MLFKVSKVTTRRFKSNYLFHTWGEKGERDKSSKLNSHFSGHGVDIVQRP